MTNMSGARLANLKERFAQAVSSGVYPVEEWKRSVNRFRVENAAKRLRSHPGLGLVVIDVAGRDKRIRRLLEAVGLEAPRR